ncbi:methyltransferase, FxLD system [Frankia gtarii]|uniref:methyltransferase, FxLD system n=1 Tax=Frankia gtarii TaxID=2950102 RepID=UPI0021BEC0EA|nr:methyltransferase, FxLD system [Frankia gtarii]
MGPGDWQQAVIEFTDRRSAELAAVQHLRPALLAAQLDGQLAGWFFVRKMPTWRLRYLHLPAIDEVRDLIGYLLDRLVADGHAVGWTAGIYEPEAVVFGGATGMDVAHELFAHDSRHVLDYLTRPSGPDEPGLGRRELAVLLTSVLLRGAGLDWYEQGDVWARVAQHRPADATTALSAERRRALTSAVHRLMTVDAGPGSRLAERGPFAGLADWSAGFEGAGQQLAELASRGALERGLRAVLTHHVIFSWNRLGLAYAEQATLATLGKEAVMAEDDIAGVTASAPTEPAGRAPAVEAAHGPVGDTAAAMRLRHALIDRLREAGTVRSDAVEAAMRAVPRHLFLPGVPLEEAYADEPVYTKRDGAGVSISAASQPTIVAMMLEQLDVQQGQRVLEIGAGTGYNAALLAHLAGDKDRVTTIDVDEDLVAGARRNLAEAARGDVQVVLGDGALGAPAGGRHDRLIATVGAFDVPPAWLDQVAPPGRLVVPVRLRGAVARSIAFDRGDGIWRSRSIEMASFMPLRGIGDDPRRIAALTDDGDVTVQLFREHTLDPDDLLGVLDQPAAGVWTGVLFAAPEPFEWMDLWLACSLDGGLTRMPVQPRAVERGLVTPQFGWGAMATVEKDSVAYLTLRPAPRAADGTTMNEVGVLAHGPDSDGLAQRVADEIRRWSRDYRARDVRIELHPDGAREATRPGQFLLDRRHTSLAVSWV